MDTWLIWNLTGGTDGGLHITDVTNASRTMLMDLETLDWDDEILRRRWASRGRCCPRSRPRQRGLRRGRAGGALAGVPIAGDLGDQQAAHVRPDLLRRRRGQEHLRHGQLPAAQHGHRGRCQSKNGLLTTVGYKIGDQHAVYCLEGSIAITGALVQWLRDNLGMIKAAPEVEELAQTVEDNGGVLHRAGVLGPVRAVLEVRRARRRSRA